MSFLLCAGKEKFESFAQAEAVRKRCKATRAGATKTYKCSECGFYHIGSTFKQKHHTPKKKHYNNFRGHAI